jgi:hypothetical protein
MASNTDTTTTPGCSETVVDVVTGDRFRCSLVKHPDREHESWSDDGLVVARWVAPRPLTLCEPDYAAR